MTEELTVTEQMTQTLSESRETLSRLVEILSGQQRQLQALQQKVAMLEKLTPMQVKDVNLRIRQRGCELEMEHALPAGGAEKLTTLIRRQVRLETGARSVRDIARCDYPVVCGLISDWEDYDAIEKARRACHA